MYRLHLPTGPHWRPFLVVATLLSLPTPLVLPILLAPSASAQEGRSTSTLSLVAPQHFGISIPAGPTRYQVEQNVITHDEEGNSVVAKLHVEVGDHRIVMLPDGQLVARLSSASPATERPFQALSKEAIASNLLRSLPADFQLKQTRRYLYLYNTSESFQLATSRILETMFPGVVHYAQAQKIVTHPPLIPMVVIMFRTEKEFREFQRVPDQVVAYYQPVSNHITMHEGSQQNNAPTKLAIQQSLSTIAHEGAHQILHNIGVQKRLSWWPMWLSEGLAEYLAPTSTGKRFRWKGAGQVNDFRMFELEQYLQMQPLNAGPGELIQNTLLAGRLTSTGYASAWALTHFLAKNRRQTFNDFVHEVSKLRPLETLGPVKSGRVPANLDFFETHFGRDLAKFETLLLTHLRKLPYTSPLANSPHWTVTFEISSRALRIRRAEVFHSQKLAQLWVKTMLEQLPAKRRAEAKFVTHKLANRPLAVQLATHWLQTRQK